MQVQITKQAHSLLPFIRSQSDQLRNITHGKLCVTQALATLTFHADAIPRHLTFLAKYILPHSALGFAAICQKHSCEDMSNVVGRLLPTAAQLLVRSTAHTKRMLT